MCGCEVGFQALYVRTSCVYVQRGGFGSVWHKDYVHPMLCPSSLLSAVLVGNLQMHLVHMLSTPSSKIEGEAD